MQLFVSLATKINAFLHFLVVVVEDILLEEEVVLLSVGQE